MLSQNVYKLKNVIESLKSELRALEETVEGVDPQSEPDEISKKFRKRNDNNLKAVGRLSYNAHVSKSKKRHAKAAEAWADIAKKAKAGGASWQHQVAAQQADYHSKKSGQSSD